MEEDKAGHRHLSDTSSVSTLYRIIFREQPGGGLSEPEQLRSTEAKDGVDAEEDTSRCFVAAAPNSPARCIRPKAKAYPSLSKGVVVDRGSRSILRHLERLSELEKEAETTTSTQLERIASRLVRSFEDYHHEGGGAVLRAPFPDQEGKPRSHQHSSAPPGRDSDQAKEIATRSRESSIRLEDPSSSTKLCMLNGRRRGLLVQENEDTEGGEVDDGAAKPVTVEDTALRQQFSTSHRKKSDGYHTSFGLPWENSQERETKRKTSRHGTSQMISFPKEHENQLPGGTPLFLSTAERAATTCEPAVSAPLSRPFFSIGLEDAGVLEDRETSQKGQKLPGEDDINSEDIWQESLSDGRYGCCFSLSQNSLLDESAADCSPLKRDVPFLKKSVTNAPTGEERGARESVLPTSAPESFHDASELTRKTAEKSFLDPNEDPHRHTDSTRSSSSPLPPSTHFSENESDSEARERRERREDRRPPLLRTTTSRSNSTSQDVEKLARSSPKEDRNLTCTDSAHARDEGILEQSFQTSQKNHDVGREDEVLMSSTRRRALLSGQGPGKEGEVARDGGENFSFSPLDFAVSQHPGVTTRGVTERTGGEWCGVSHDAESPSLVEGNKKDEHTTTKEKCSSESVEVAGAVKSTESTCCCVATTELGGGRYFVFCRPDRFPRRRRRAHREY